ncbi:hypothetical protein IPF86_03120 [Candidatus Nomurabacteria bacterium]|nr:MAG: hypothetical protein IPF86_03120 [Candidatus Nomurabacteria bacterium]
MFLDLIKRAYAAGPIESSVDSLLAKINKVILNPLIILMFAVALVYFMYGVVEFLANSTSEDARKTGKAHMLYGVIGMFIMIAVYAIMNIIVNTLGVTNINIPNPR